MDISFRRPDGKDTRGYLVMPEEGEQAPAVVMIHEWWGVNDQIKHMADRLSEEGFRVMVPDLFGGRTAKIGDAAGATKLMNGLDKLAAVQQDIQGAVKHLKERGGGRVAVMGFCMGGALALAAGVHVREADAAICFYGVPDDNQLADPRLVRIPLQCHFATQDDWCTPQIVDHLERGLKAGGVNFELHRYNAKHAFMNDQRPEVYDPHNAKIAWDRALSFLGSTIGGHVAGHMVAPRPLA